jgi:transcriptional regulator with XRE-family HTH domain
MADTWRTWVLHQMSRHGWTSQADVVRSSSLTRSAISQWLDEDRDQQPTIENCRKAAEAFGVPILEVLVAAGHITAEEAGQPPAPPVGGAVELLEDIQRQIREFGAQDNPVGRHSQETPRLTEVSDVAFHDGSLGQADQQDRAEWS